MQSKEASSRDLEQQFPLRLKCNRKLVKVIIKVPITVVQKNEKPQSLFKLRRKEGTGYELK